MIKTSIFLFVSPRHKLQIGSPQIRLSESTSRYFPNSIGNVHLCCVLLEQFPHCVISNIPHEFLCSFITSFFVCFSILEISWANASKPLNFLFKLQTLPAVTALRAVWAFLFAPLVFLFFFSKIIFIRSRTSSKCSCSNYCICFHVCCCCDRRVFSTWRRRWLNYRENIFSIFCVYWIHLWKSTRFSKMGGSMCCFWLSNNHTMNQIRVPMYTPVVFCDTNNFSISSVFVLRSITSGFGVWFVFTSLDDILSNNFFILRLINFFLMVMDTQT